MPADRDRALPALIARNIAVDDVATRSPNTITPQFRPLAPSVCYPVQELAHGVDLVIVAPMREGQNLHLQIVEPRGGLRDQDMPGFDLGRCRRRAGHLVALGLERNRAHRAFATEILDERGAGARVLDQDRVSSMILGECDDPLLEAGGQCQGKIA